MNRRNTLLALGGALPLALAARSLKAQPYPAVNVTTWRAGTLQYGTLAKETSQYALLRSTNQFVKDFATSEIEEQTAFAQALNASPNPPPAPLTAAQQEMLTTVMTVPASEFDATYLMIQTKGHEMLLQLQIGLLADGLPYTSAAVQQAVVAKAFIETHLTALSLLTSYNQ